MSDTTKISFLAQLAFDGSKPPRMTAKGPAPRRRPPGNTTGLSLCLLACLSLTGCSSASEPGASTSQSAAPTTTSIGSSTTSAPTTSATVTTIGRIRQTPITGTNIVLRYDADVSPDTLSLVETALKEAVGQFGDAGPVTANVYSTIDDYVSEISKSGQAGSQTRQNLERGGGLQATPRALWLYQGAMQAGSVGAQHIYAIHEYFHDVQFYLSGYKRVQGGDSPRWLCEGTAVYFQLQAGAMLGYHGPAFSSDAFEPNKQTEIRMVKRANFGALSTYESPGSAGEGDAHHQLGFIAADYLADRYGINALKHDYWVALARMEWHQAFAATFGVSVDQFYSDFENYRKRL